jgi:hypothetical protein
VMVSCPLLQLAESHTGQVYCLLCMAIILIWKGYFLSSWVTDDLQEELRTPFCNPYPPLKLLHFLLHCTSPIFPTNLCIVFVRKCTASRGLNAGFRG